MTPRVPPAILPAVGEGGLDIDALLASPEAQAFGALLLALLIGYAISTALMGALLRATARTQTDLDDRAVTYLRRPIVVTAALVGLEWAGDLLRLGPTRQALFDGALGTVAIGVWMLALVRAGDVALATAAGRPGSLFAGRATSLLQYGVRLVVLGAATYFFALLWGLDLAAWGVSAGVVGVVLALAAQDSLGNLISGTFILADAPLRIGDVVQIDDARAQLDPMRGRVADIGWRSTRIVTNDGVEINLPNSVLGAARVVNESGGPREAVRIRVEFPVTPALTPEQVAALVEPGAAALPDVLADPPPRAYFLGKTEVGLQCALLVYTGDPGRRSNVIDAVNSHVYRRLLAAGAPPARMTHELQLDGPLAAELAAALVTARPQV